MRTCQKCGAEVEKDDRYCPECGIKIEFVKQPTKITVWSLFKIIGAIILFIIFVNLLKSGSSASVLPALIIIPVVIYTGLGFLNWFLKKIFNTEMSTGVKIIITAIIIGLLLISVNQTSTLKPIAVRPLETERVMLVETENLYVFVEKINSIVNSKDSSSLKTILENGMITKEVFEDLQGLMDKNEMFNVYLKPQQQNFYGNRAELKVIVIIEREGEQRVTGVMLFFERTDRGWALFKIDPRLIDVKLQRSFEEELESKIRIIPQPTDATQKTQESKIDTLACATEPGKAIYGGTEKCCGGLKPMFGYEDSNGICHCTEEGNNCGGALICAPCGNGMCEKHYSEDRCSCPEDCK